MRRSGIGLPVWCRLLSMLTACLLPAAASGDPLSDLDQTFQATYAKAADQTLVGLRSSAPVLVNAFGQIAFYRPGVSDPEIFTMDSGLFQEASAVAHAPVTFDAELLPYGLGGLDRARRDWLAHYQASLEKADEEVMHRPDLPPDLRAAQHDILIKVGKAVRQARRTRQVDQRALDELGAAVRADIQLSLRAAAASQLSQFRAQIEQWKTAFPNLAWNRAVVVVVAGHQPRNKQLQRQFFDWLLRDDPARQDRVVYAETLDRTPPLDQRPASEAMLLLSKVMLDKALAGSILNDPSALQSDALGPAATEIIRGWRAE